MKTNQYNFTEYRLVFEMTEEKKKKYYYEGEEVKAKKKYYYGEGEVKAEKEKKGKCKR